MKGIVAMEFSEEQMCEIVQYWLKSRFSSHGEIGDHIVSEFTDTNDKSHRPESTFRITLTPKPKEEKE